LVMAMSWPFGYWQAWAYLILSLAASVTIVAYLRRADPKLLERRFRGPLPEKELGQNLLQLTALTVLSGTIVLSALDRYFAWSNLLLSATIIGFAILVIGYLVIFLALRENTFAAVNIEVEAGQTVISTGPYAIVRHPYYLGLILWIIGTPLALGSWWGLVMLVPMLVVIAKRIAYEERFLTTHLLGYAAYCKHVRFRLLPLVW